MVYRINLYECARSITMAPAGSRGGNARNPDNFSGNPQRVAKAGWQGASMTLYANT